MLILDKCLIGLKKAADSLIDTTDYSKIKEFLKLWYDLNKYAKELFVCFYLSSFFKDFNPIKYAKKDVLKLVQVSKKAKGLDDLVMVAKPQITTL